MKCIFLVLSIAVTSLFSAQGIEYTQFQTPHYICYTTVHMIEIDPNLYEIRPVKALDNGIGRESVLSMSSRYGAIAAINGTFFSMRNTLDGRTTGALKINEWYSIPHKPRGCIGWSLKDPFVKMDRLLINIHAICNSKDFFLNGLNRFRKKGEAILFTPCFHRTTLTNSDGKELVIVNGIIQEIVRGGSIKIPENGHVLSIQETHPLFDFFEIGMPFTFSMQISPSLDQIFSDEWGSFDYILGGTPLLIHDGVKITDFAPERTLSTFLSNKHSRTVVGIRPNGNWIFVVADRTGFCDGMTMSELADLMEDLGCVQALNLDGGGSSTMVFEGNLKNSPHGDEDEGLGVNSTRRVSDAILVFPKNN